MMKTSDFDSSVLNQDIDGKNIDEYFQCLLLSRPMYVILSTRNEKFSSCYTLLEQEEICSCLYC
jgi:hypothetical protein